MNIGRRTANDVCTYTCEVSDRSDDLLQTGRALDTLIDVLPVCLPHQSSLFMDRKYFSLMIVSMLDLARVYLHSQVCARPCVLCASTLLQA